MRSISRLVLVLLFVLPPRVLRQVTLLRANSPDAANNMLLTGRVTSAEDGTPLADIEVRFIDNEFPLDVYVAAHTDSNGYYTATASQMDSWWILFEPLDQPYFAEYHDDVSVSNPAAATVFTFAPDMNVTGIDAALAPKPEGASQITGQVTREEGGDPLANVTVNVYAENGELLKVSEPTDSTGAYTVTALAAGNYKLRFWAGDVDDFIVSEFHNNKTILDTADLVTVGMSETVQVDAALAPAGVITGFVTSSASGLENVFAFVTAYDAAGNRVAQGDTIGTPNGSYAVTNLPAGQYRLLMTDRNHQHRPEYYNDVQELAQGQLVTVTPGQVTPNINVELAITPTVVAIATSRALPNDIVLAMLHETSPIYTVNGGALWHAFPSTPWVTTPSYSADPSVSLALVPRTGWSERRFLYGMRQDGLYRSGDLGNTWAKQGRLHACDGSSGFEKVTVTPLEAERLYAFEVCTILRNSSPSTTRRLLISDDGGASWHTLPVIVEGTELFGHTSVVPSPVLPDRVYLLTLTPGGQSSEFTWFESNDAGDSWAKKDFPLFELVLDGKNSEVLYGWQEVYGPPYYRVWMRSEDGGESWEEWAEQPCIGYFDPVQLLADLTTEKLLYMRCADGLFRSTNGGDAWEQLDEHSGSYLALDYGVPGRLLWAKPDGLWASPDQGDTWEALTDDFAVTPAQRPVPLYLPSVAAPAGEGGQ